MKPLRRHKLNNKGASLVTVVATIALVAVLAVTVLTISVANVQMKMMYKKSIDNFYDAESAMDEIRTGLQQEISSAATVAYREVMESYSSSYNNDTQRQNSFVSKYRTELTNTLQSTLGYYNIATLESYIGASHRYDASTNVGADILTQPGDNKLEFATDGIYLRNLEVAYTSSDGYYTKVTTDLVLTYPHMNFTQNTSAPDLLSYVMVADQGVLVNNMTRTLTANGNIYAGDFNVADGEERGLSLSTNAMMELGVGNNLITRGGITLEEGSSLKTGKKTNLWTDNILVKSHATYDVSGSSHVADDLTIQGCGDVSLRGEYFGYGNPLSLRNCLSLNSTEVDNNPSDYSSAIVINGIADTGKSRLYMNDLTYLMLAGNAYIGTNGAMMGESLTIKSSQLAYLAPVSCFNKTGGVDPSNPTSVPAANSSLNMAELARYGASGVTTKQSTDGLYYYFLKFDNAKDALAYTKKYYSQASNQSKLEDYVSLYVADQSISVRENRLTADSNGSILLWDNTGVRSINPDGIFDTYEDISDDAAKRTLQMEYYDMYSAYNCNLTTDYGNLSTAQTSSTVFNNLISVSEIQSIVPSGSTRKFSYDNAGITYSAVVANGDYTFDSSSTATSEEIHLIIATGDVTVKKDFEGLIICGGAINVPMPAGSSSSTSVESSATEVANLLDLAVYNNGATDYKLDSIVTDASYYLARLSSTDSGSSQVDMSDYIIYQNWSKE